MSDETILVTGGSGMVGNNIQSLVQKDTNHWIFLSSRDCDLTDLKQVKSLFEKYRPTRVIHLAANVAGLYKHLNERVEMFRNNILMNQYIVDCCHLYNVQKAIFCLSTCVFPANPPSFPMTEEMIHSGPPHHSNASYAYSKRMLKQACDNYNWQYNRQYICVCPVNLYGKWDNFHLEDSHVIPGLIHKMFTIKDSLKLPGTGLGWRQFLYAEDFAKIILQVLEHYTEKDMMICAPDSEIMIRDLVDKISSVMEYTGKIEYDSSKSDGILKKTASNQKLRKFLPDFEFTSLEDGLRETINWFKETYPNVRK